MRRPVYGPQLSSPKFFINGYDQTKQYFKVSSIICAFSGIEPDTHVAKAFYHLSQREREKGQQPVYYTSPQSFIIHFLICYLLNDFGTFVNFDSFGWFIRMSVHTLQPLFLIYRRGNFVNHHWGYTSIYRPLSYTFRSLRHSHLLKSLVLCALSGIEPETHVTTAYNPEIKYNQQAK